MIGVKHEFDSKDAIKTGDRLIRYGWLVLIEKGPLKGGPFFLADRVHAKKTIKFKVPAKKGHHMKKLCASWVGFRGWNLSCLSLMITQL